MRLLLLLHARRLLHVARSEVGHCHWTRIAETCPNITTGMLRRRMASISWSDTTHDLTVTHVTGMHRVRPVPPGGSNRISLALGMGSLLMILRLLLRLSWSWILLLLLDWHSWVRLSMLLLRMRIHSSLRLNTSCSSLIIWIHCLLLLLLQIRLLLLLKALLGNPETRIRGTRLMLEMLLLLLLLDGMTCLRISSLLLIISTAALLLVMVVLRVVGVLIELRGPRPVLLFTRIIILLLLLLWMTKSMPRIRSRVSSLGMAATLRI